MNEFGIPDAQLAMPGNAYGLVAGSPLPVRVDDLDQTGWVTVAETPLVQVRGDRVRLVVTTPTAYNLNRADALVRRLVAGARVVDRYMSWHAPRENRSLIVYTYRSA